MERFFVHLIKYIKEILGFSLIKGYLYNILLLMNTRNFTIINPL